MNNLYAREKVNRLHLDELRREAQNRHLLREISPIKEPQNALQRLRTVALALVVLVAAIAFFIRI